MQLVRERGGMLDATARVMRRQAGDLGGFL
jgi:hypothetical protein